MLSVEENETLTRVGPGTKMGALLRQYWMPTVLSDELKADGAPKKVPLMGERLVAFRDTEGNVGMLDELCPHRGASLALARNEECGLRCLYHGWKITHDGKVVDTPAEPEDSNFKDKIRNISYPVVEAGGIVWTYIGPQTLDGPPPFPRWEWADAPPERIIVSKVLVEANWLQGVEGTVDSAHLGFLHQGAMKATARVAALGGVTEMTKDGFERPSADVRPRLEVENTHYGFRYAALRKPVTDADKNQYVRISHFIAPLYVTFPAPKGTANLIAFVPLNDEQSYMYFIRYATDGEFSAEMREFILGRAGLLPGVDLTEDHGKIRNVANNWLQDRSAMESGESFTGIYGVPNQDLAVEESMGAIFDRSKEHLGMSDMAVIRMRRRMLEAVAKVGQGETSDLMAHGPEFRPEMLRGFETVAPLTTSWQSLIDGPAAPVDSLAGRG
jgi:phthalate 4,5-dioxygenase oxygenase subunit